MAAARLIRFLSTCEARKTSTRRGRIGTSSPVLGLRPTRRPFWRTAKLPKVDVAKPEHVVGKTTVESIQSGCYFGYVALVDGLVSRMKREMGEPVRVLATGGLATVIAGETQTIEEVDENLTLDGLRILYERNRY